MKKLLGLFTTLSVIATAGSSVVSCFDFKITPDDPKEVDLQIDLADYAEYDALEKFVLEPYQDDTKNVLDELFIFSNVEMALKFANVVGLKTNPSVLREAMEDTTDFKDHYEENYSTLTTFGYAVINFTKTALPSTIYGTITNTPTNDDVQI
jgi:hypothetical protein